MLYVIVWIFCGIIAAAIYKNKGRSPVSAFFVGLLLGPIGVILTLLSSTDTQAVEQKQLATGASKKCPHCAELVKADARVCKHCARDLA